MRLSEFIERHKIQASVEYGTNDPIPDGMRNMNPWTVTLKTGRRRLTVPFFTGYGWKREPDAADVLDCLASDAAGWNNARSFEEWCSDYGYDSDSRKAEAIYRQVEKQSIKLQEFMGDLFTDLIWDTERE